VTGAGGFIGRCSLGPLLARGYEVHASSLHPAAKDLLLRYPSVHWHAVDLLESRAAAALMTTVAPSHLLHFAWIATPGVYWTSADNPRWLVASESLLDAFIRHGGVRVVMAGSCAEYDWSRAGICDEHSSPLADAGASAADAHADAKLAAPPSPYALCKLKLARSLAATAHRVGISSAWGRIFFQYGPHEHRDRLVASVIVSLLERREALCSPGLQVRSFLHVADLGEAFAQLLDSPLEGPVNIGSAERITVAALIERIAAETGGAEFVRLGARPAPAGEPALLVPALSRLRDELGWTPAFSLERGIADTVAWWRRALAVPA
jgi:nucleoside-diphosphate-sugar epimerase